MKVKLLKKLRAEGWNMISINSYTESYGSTTQMSYGCPGKDYYGLFSYGDTPEDVHKKASKIYMKKNMDFFRKKYRKYTRKYKDGKRNGKRRSNKRS